MAKDVTYENEVLSFSLIFFNDEQETNVNINMKPEITLKDTIEALLVG
jgi:hypothetical protein